jgi:hypothetical protein
MGEALLENGTIVSVSMNSPHLGTDTYSLDDTDQTGIRAQVWTHGVGVVEENGKLLTQFRVVDELSGDWFVYARTGISTGRLIVRGPDKLRTIGALLATFLGTT